MEYNIYDKFEALTDTLVEIQDPSDSSKLFKPSFGYGSKDDLNKYIVSKYDEQGGVNYPLIWLQTPVTLTGEIMKSSEFNFLLGTLSSLDLSNKVRNEVTFKGILCPLLKDFIQKIDWHNSMKFLNKDQRKETQHFNFKELKNDIWDVLGFRCEIEFNTNC